MHGKEQARQSKVMIAMEVADENVIDPVEANTIFRKLHLRSFAAIDQDMMVLDVEIMRGGESAVGWHGAAGSEDRELEGVQ